MQFNPWLKLNLILEILEIADIKEFLMFNDGILKAANTKTNYNQNTQQGEYKPFFKVLKS